MSLSSETLLANVKRYLTAGESVLHVQHLCTCVKSPLGWAQTGTAYVTSWRVIFLQDVVRSK